MKDAKKHPFRWFCGFFFILFFLIFFLESVTAIESGTEEEAWITWIKEMAIPLKTLDWDKVDLTELSFLDRELEGNRIVYLGEPDHYIHEKYDFRLILIRYLFEKGWRHIGMEIGRSDGKKADRYLETGDPLWLERMALLGYKGDQRTDRDDSKKVGKARKNPAFLKAFLSEKKWFFSQLRSINENLAPEQSRLCWFGFDADTYPGGGYADARAILERRKNDPLIKEILEKLTRVEKESVEQEVERLKNVLISITNKENALKYLLGEEDAKELKGTVHCLMDSFTYLIASKTGSRSELWLPMLREREKTMFRQMDEKLADLPSDAKIILMGHNLHLSKNYRSLSYGGVVDMWPSIGTHISEKLEGEVYSIWMLYDHGRHADAGTEKAFEDVPSDPRRIESLMARAGRLFLLPLASPDPRSGFLDEERWFVVNGDRAKGLLRENADAIFFVAEVTVPRERRENP
jgi:erythromycin esterase-like protein